MYVHYVLLTVARPESTLLQEIAHYAFMLFGNAANVTLLCTQNIMFQICLFSNTMLQIVSTLSCQELAC